MRDAMWIGVKALLVIGFVLAGLKALVGSEALVFGLGVASGGFAEGFRDGQTASPPDPSPLPWILAGIVAGLLVLALAFGVWFEVREARTEGRDHRAIDARIRREIAEQNRAAIEADVFRPVSEWIAEAEAVAVKEWRR
jgi:hypothetical protein